MDRNAADLIMVLVGVTSVVLLLTWGLLTAAAGGGFDPVFWLLAVAFLIYVGWDTTRHVRAMRVRSAAPAEKKR